MKGLSLISSLFLMGALASCSSVRYDYVYVPGKTAVIVDGKAVLPEGAPERVKKAVEAGNRIVGKPYVYGGGHGQIEDGGYDCSGTVSYVLYHAGLLRTPQPSGAFRSFGADGKGEWITLYAKSGHVFVSLAGLRLDTGYSGEGQGPRWSTKSRPANGCTLRHPPQL